MTMKWQTIKFVIYA